MRDKGTFLALGGLGVLAAIALGAGKAGASGAPSERAPKRKTTSPGLVQALAENLAADIRARRYDYSRQLCRDFQSAVGFTGRDVDGIYGPKTYTALRDYVRDAPRPLFKGASSEAKAKATVRTPRDLAPSPWAGESVERLSERLASDLEARGYDYDRKLCADFQRAAGGGLEPDGIYGPLTADRLKQYQPDARDALFKPRTRAVASATSSRTSSASASKAPKLTVGPAQRKTNAKEIARSMWGADSEKHDISQLTPEQWGEIEDENQRMTRERTDAGEDPAADALYQIKMIRALRAAQKAAQAKRARKGAPTTPGELAIPPDGGMDADTDAGDAESADASPEDAGAEQADAGDSTQGDTLADLPPAMPVNLELARREARAVAAHVRKRGRQYSRQLVRDFQRHAGIASDGVYGPRTVEAVRYFGGDAPDALYGTDEASYAPADAEGE